MAESPSEISVKFAANDGSADANVVVGIESHLPESRLFGDLAAASAFFERGSTGFSATHDPDRFDGLALRTTAWRVDPAKVVQVHSSFFSDTSAVPRRIDRPGLRPGDEAHPGHVGTAASERGNPGW